MSIAFRPDVEGIRALAILLVVGAHSQFPGMTAGFIGVDVFFVVSGYLISALLISEKRATNRIDFGTFYARRFRRLLPALMLMLACISIAVWQLLPSFRQSESALSAGTATFWASNIQFALYRADYFGLDSQTNTFLHTWSLGVEEQFYLIWPALIAVSMGVRGTAKRRLLPVLVWIFALSLALSIWLTSYQQSSAFFLMPTRAWQFSAGSLTFILTERFAHRAQAIIRSDIGRLMSWSGIAILLLGLLLISETEAYPGVWAILPTTATSLLLAGNMLNAHSPVARALSTAPAQWFGQISYSWYLWHWPTISLGTALISSSSPNLPIAMALASLFPAWLSFKLLEQPIRNANALLIWPRRTILGALLIMVAFGIAAMQWYFRAEDARTAHDRVQISRPRIYAMGCDDWHSSSSLNPCRFGDERHNGTILVIGDSVGLQWFPAIERIARARDMRLVILTKSACPIVDADYFYEHIGRTYVECREWRNSALDFASSHSPQWLIIGSSANYPFSETEWREGSSHVLATASRSADAVMILRSTPSVPFDGPTCALQASAPSVKLEFSSACVAPASNPASRAIWRWINDAATDFHNVRTIDMNALVCPDEQCHPLLENQLVFRDSTHLDGNFAERLSDALGAKLDEAVESIRAAKTDNNTPATRSAQRE